MSQGRWIVFSLHDPLLTSTDHPYQRNPYGPPNAYFDQPPYAEMLPPNYAGPPYGAFLPGGQPAPDYVLPPGYGKVPPSQPQGGAYYYLSNPRAGQAPQPPSPAHY